MLSFQKATPHVSKHHHDRYLSRRSVFGDPDLELPRVRDSSFRRSWPKLLAFESLQPGTHEAPCRRRLLRTGMEKNSGRNRVHAAHRSHSDRFNRPVRRFVLRNGSRRNVCRLRSAPPTFAHACGEFCVWTLGPFAPLPPPFRRSSDKPWRNESPLGFCFWHVSKTQHHSSSRTIVHGMARRSEHRNHYQIVCRCLRD